MLDASLMRILDVHEPDHARFYDRCSSAMYPFQKTLDIDSSEESCSNSNGHLINGRAHMASLRNAERGPDPGKKNSGIRVTRIASMREGELIERESQHYAPRLVGCISRSLGLVFYLLRVLALFPSLIQRGNNRRRKRYRRLLMTIFLFNFSVFMVLFNLFLLRGNTWLTLEYVVDLSFRSAFRASPPVRHYVYSFLFVSASLFSIPLAYRIFEFVGTEKVLFESPLDDLGFLIVPLLMMWNTLPLLYYCLYNRLVRFYLREAIGMFFNPFVLFSLAWSMAILCLTIYFITLPTSSLWEPINAAQVLDEVVRQDINKRVHFSIGWAALQIAVALMHIALICQTGMQTNETTRQVVNAVLRVVPDTNAELDRFQISCFVHKMSTQFMWGMTVWRAFPLERSTFFTMVSVIVTYSFLLIKLKENPSISPVTRTIYITPNISVEAL